MVSRSSQKRPRQHCVVRESDHMQVANLLEGKCDAFHKTRESESDETCELAKASETTRRFAKCDREEHSKLQMQFATMPCARKSDRDGLANLKKRSQGFRELAKKRPRCFGFCQSRKAIAMNRLQRRKLKRATVAYRNCDRDATAMILVSRDEGNQSNKRSSFETNSSINQLLALLPCTRPRKNVCTNLS